MAVRAGSFCRGFLPFQALRGGGVAPFVRQPAEKSLVDEFLVFQGVSVTAKLSVPQNTGKADTFAAIEAASTKHFGMRAYYRLRNEIGTISNSAMPTLWRLTQSNPLSFGHLDLAIS